MRILLVFCLVIAISEGNHKGIVKRGPNDAPSLRQITSDLSILSRIVSGIALQNAITEKSLPVDELVSELLKVQTSSIFQDLKALDLESIGKDLGTLEAIKTTVGDLKIANPKAIQKTLWKTPTYFKDLPELTDASDQAKSADFITKADKIVGKKLDMKLLEDQTIRTIAQHLGQLMSATEPGDSDLAAHKLITDSIAGLQKNIDPFLQLISELKDFRNSATFVALTEFSGTLKWLNSLKILKKYALEFESNQFKILSKQFGGLGNELGNLTVIQKDQALLETLKTSLEAVKKVMKEFKDTKPLANPKLLISIDDINKMFVDIKGPWFERVISEGNGPTALQNSTQILEKFSTEMNGLEKGFEDLVKTQVSAFGNVLKRLENLGKGLEMWKVDGDLTNSVKNSQTCFQPIVHLPMTAAQDIINPYECLLLFIGDLAKSIEDSLKILDEVAAHPLLADTTVLNAIKKEIPTPANNQMTKTDFWPMVQKVQAVAGGKELVLQLKEVADMIKSVNKFDTLTASRDFSPISKMSAILTDSQLIPAIECLKNMNFDPKPLKNLMKIGKDIRGIKAEEASSLKDVALKLQKFSDDYQKINVGSSSRRRRRHRSQNLKLQNSLQLSQDLASGVALLNELTLIMDQKEDIEKAVGFGSVVDQAIWKISMPPMMGFWNQKSKKLLGDVVLEIEALDAVVKSSNQKILSDVYGVLENATTLQGIPGFKAELFENPISVDLEASTKQDVKDAAPVFKSLASLKLDFSSNKKILQSAHATLKPIRDFFDNLFGIDRSPPTVAPGVDPGDDSGDGVSNNGTSGAMASAQSGVEKKDDSMFLYICAAAGGVMVFIVIIVVIICCVKRKNQRAKLANPETWRHLRFLAEGKLVKADDSEYTPMHLAVKKNKLEEVKRRVKNGAYINVWSMGKMIETPLHTAVANGKPEMVEFLIKNGADMKALDSNYDSPKDKAKGKPTVLKVIKKYEKKVFKKKLPQTLPANKYKLFIDKSISAGLKDFCKSFKSNIVENLESATHVVVKTGKDGILDLDSEEGLTYLNVIFSKQILMRSDWIQASVKNRKAFANDYEHRVTKIRFKGKTYKSMDEIQEAFQKMKVGYLTNATIHFNQGAFATVDWGSLKETATNLGGTLVDEFPVMQGMLAEQHPYYRDDLGHIFVVYKQENAAELEAQYPYLRTEKSYTFLEHDEFIALLLDYKITNKKMKSKRGKKSKESKSKSVSKSKESGSEGSKETPSKEPETGTPAAGGSQDNANPSAEDSNGGGAPGAPGFDAPLAAPAAPDALGGAPDPFAPPTGGVPVGADPWANP